MSLMAYSQISFLDVNCFGWQFGSQLWLMYLAGPPLRVASMRFLPTLNMYVESIPLVS